MKLLDYLTIEERENLATTRFKKEEILYHEGDPCKGLYVVSEGEIKISSYSLKGSEIVYNVIHAGQVFGNNLVFASDDRFRGNVVGLSDGALVFIDQERLISFMQGNAGFLKEYLRLQSDFGKSLNAKLKLLSFVSAEDRLAFYFQQHGNRIHFRSITSLADELFIKRETLSRLMHRLAEEGKISLAKNSATLV